MTKLILIIFFTSIFAALFIAYLMIKRKNAQKIFDEAVELEGEGKIEEACYRYAEAEHHGAKAQDCKERILKLWDKHGPFDFDKQLEALKKEHADSEGYAERHHETILEHIIKILPDYK